jgi:outer membrane lipoprotein-sorting protein
MGGALMRLSLLACVAAGALFFAAGSSLANAQAAPSRLKTVLAQMDAGSEKFRSAEASIQKQQFEKVVNDTTTQSGTIYFQHIGGTILMGAKFDPPNAQTIEYKNGTVSIYTLGTNQLKTYSTSQNQALVQTFLALGAGGSGRDLAANWTITDQGTEKMSDGLQTVEVEKLDLVSKDASVRNTYTHITIWIDPLRDISLKQVAFAPSGDTDTTIYTNIKLNQPIDTKTFAINCKKCS